MGKASRDKGHNFERWVAKQLREIWPDAKRGFQTRGGTAEEPDVKGCGPFAIECKAHKKVDRVAAFDQMAAAVPAKFIPVAIFMAAILSIMLFAGDDDESPASP